MKTKSFEDRCLGNWGKLTEQEEQEVAAYFARWNKKISKVYQAVGVGEKIEPKPDAAIIDDPCS